MGQVLCGDALEMLKTLPDESVQCCVTSPPYWGLRAYGTNPIIWADSKPLCDIHQWVKAPPRRRRTANDVINQESKQATSAGTQHDLKETDVCENCGAWRGELGLEPTPELYVKHITQVFREVRRVLRNDGTLWLNLGDSYAGSWGASGHRSEIDGGESTQRKKNTEYFARGGYENHRETPPTAKQLAGIKPKDLVGIPWMVAFALRADGWWLRSDIIWSKPNPMPESVTDRPTKAHEYIFLLTKSANYYYDAEAVKNPPTESLLQQLRDGYDGEAIKDYAAAGVQNPSATKSRIIENKLRKTDKQRGHSRRHAGFNDRWDSMTKEEQCALGSNRRTVWTVATQPRKEAHFATFPDEIPEICIKAGTKKGDIVLDPFGGSGTTAQVAKRLSRDYIIIDLNPEYVKELIEPSLEKINPLFNES